MSETEEIGLLEQIQTREPDKKAPEPVSGEIYEELLSRYEKALFFAGQLQEQVRSGRLLAERNQDLRAEVRRLKDLVGSAEKYVEVLEGALESLGVSEDSDGESEGEGSQKSP